MVTMEATSMELSSISASLVQSAGSTAIQGRHGHGNMKSAMDAAAKALGMSQDDLKSAFDSGETLESLAESKGISKDDLIKAMASAIKDGDSGLTTDAATSIATRMATQGPPPPPPGGMGGPGGPGGPGGEGGRGGGTGKVAMDTAASTLGMTTSELFSSLQDGSTLADVASSKGISEDDLVTAITTALESADPTASADTAKAFATRMVEQGPPGASSRGTWGIDADGGFDIGQYVDTDA
jgi:uncharacterized protein YidB (DUF937 family)